MPTRPEGRWAWRACLLLVQGLAFVQGSHAKAGSLRCTQTNSEAGFRANCQLPPWQLPAASQALSSTVPVTSRGSVTQFQGQMLEAIGRHSSRCRRLKQGQARKAAACRCSAAAAGSAHARCAPGNSALPSAQSRGSCMVPSLSASARCAWMSLDRNSTCRAAGAGVEGS